MAKYVTITKTKLQSAKEISMKTRTKKIAFEKIEKIKRPKHKNPVRPNIFFRQLIQTISIPDIKAVNTNMGESSGE